MNSYGLDSNTSKNQTCVYSLNLKGASWRTVWSGPGLNTLLFNFQVIIALSCLIAFVYADAGAEAGANADPSASPDASASANADADFGYGAVGFGAAPYGAGFGGAGFGAGAGYGRGAESWGGAGDDLAIDVNHREQWHVGRYVQS